MIDFRPEVAPPPPPPGASRVFGSRLPLAREYAGLLSHVGTVRGMIGPREIPRLWERHIINSAIVTDLISTGAKVIDIGSGAGLPGLAIAIRRPDLNVVLVESSLRRTEFLSECIQILGLVSVSIIRGRAEDLHSDLAGDVVTARAVAPLSRLIPLTLPLVRAGGELMAFKGSKAEEEVRQATAVLRKSGVSYWQIQSITSEFPPTTVVRVFPRP
jgi:16S rRNA (guanine527-N7)-methyltransferase